MDDLLVVLRVALSLAAVLGLLWYLQRRFSRQSSRRRDAETITVLGRQGLGAKAQLVMVQTADARYVLGVTEHGVSVVDRLPVGAVSDADPDAVTAAPSLNAVSQHPAVAKAPDEPNAVAFDRILRGETSPPTHVQTHAPVTRLRVRHRSDPLKGSIISPETWRQTAEAIRRSR